MKSLDNPLVSVIVPVYNTEKYLKRCFASIQSQTYTNLEIILVDDGSPDDCPLICDQLAAEDARVKVIHQNNRGLWAARNAGLDAAAGEWLCFIDSDDFIDSRFVEILLETAASNDCLTARCKRAITFKSFPDIKQPPKETKTFDWFEYAAFLDNTPGHTVHSVCWSIYHRCLFDTLRFLPFSHTEDSPVTTSIIWHLRDRRFVVTNQILYYYYQNPNSILRAKTSLRSLERYKSYQWLLDFWEKKNQPEMAHIYFKAYYTKLILDYTEMHRDIPEEHEQYRHLYDLIKSGMIRARSLNLKVVELAADSKRIWGTISDSQANLVIYGYNNRSIELIPWLLYFGINVIEVWDYDFEENALAHTLPVSVALPHQGFRETDNTLIAIALDHVGSSMIVKNKLRQLGQDKFISCENIFGAVKYAKYSRFLPFLLE